MRAVRAAVLLFVFACLPLVASSSPPSPSSPPGPASGTIGVVTITLGVAGGVAVLAAIIAIALTIRRRKLQDARDMEVIESSLAFSESFSFPLHLVSAAEFARMGKLIIFEDVRMAGQHRVMDLVEDARHLFQPSSHSRLIFLSHQWLAFNGPDPSGVQYKVMVAAVKAVVKKNEWDLRNAWVWVDYACVPQRHKQSQLAAIDSLALYASFANALVIAAPDAEHVGTGQFASAKSYQDRAWCRAEQVCYLVRHGAENMFLATSKEEIKLVDHEWLMTSMLVFEGSMTCCTKKHVFNGVEQPCDRLALLKPICGLYANLYLDRLGAAKNSKKLRLEGSRYGGDGGPESSDAAAFSLEALMDWIDVPENKARMFPATFQLTTEKRGTRTTRLFGDMISKMELLQKKRFEQSLQKARLELQGESEGSTRKSSRAGTWRSNHGAVTQEPRSRTLLSRMAKETRSAVRPTAGQALSPMRERSEKTRRALAEERVASLKAALDDGQKYLESRTIRLLRATRVADAAIAAAEKAKAEADEASAAVVEARSSAAAARAELVELRAQHERAVNALNKGLDPLAEAEAGAARSTPAVVISSELPRYASNQGRPVRTPPARAKRQQSRSTSSHSAAESAQSSRTEPADAGNGEQQLLVV